jgi:hypothetical protein
MLMKLTQGDEVIIWNFNTCREKRSKKPIIQTASTLLLLGLIHRYFEFVSELPS